MYKVKRDFPGSPDGMTTIQFKAGEPFTETGDLLAVAIANDLVEEFKEQSPQLDLISNPQTVTTKARNAVKNFANKLTGK